MSQPYLFCLIFVLQFLALAVAAYYFLNEVAIVERFAYVDPVEDIQILLGTILIVLVLEATRRTSGLPLVIVALCFIAYALFGANLPGPLAHTEISYEALIEQLFLLTEGIYGVAITAAATMIFCFCFVWFFFRSFHHEQFIY